MASQATDFVLPPLRDRVRPGIAVLFVGINPGVRSALTGHHFAGYSNRFWKLLYDSGLVPERLTYADDDRLPGFGYGITNLVPRATRGIDELTPADYAAGRSALERKIRRLRPRVVALVGITLAHALVRGAPAPAARNVTRRRARNGGSESAGLRRLGIGPRDETLGGRPVFVLPNPSGRNANFTYAEMLAAFVALRRWLEA